MLEPVPREEVGSPSSLMLRTDLDHGPEPPGLIGAGLSKAFDRDPYLVSPCPALHFRLFRDGVA